MKKIVLPILIIIISLNVNAQLAEIITPRKQNIAYYDTLSVFKNHKIINKQFHKTFIYEDSNKLYINDLELIIVNKSKFFLGDERAYRIEYNLIDIKNNKYYLNLLFGFGLPYQGGLIAQETGISYYFARTF